MHKFHFNKTLPSVIYILHSKLFLSTCDAFVQFAIFMQFSTVIKNFIGLTLGSLLSHLLSFVLLNATYRDKMEWVFKKK